MAQPQSTPTMQDEPITPEDLKRAGVKPKMPEKVDPVKVVEAHRVTVDKANDAEDDADEQLKEPEEGDFPDWVKVPGDFHPPPGRTVIAMRFKGSWTDTPRKGERQCILMSLTEGDEKLAYKRTRGESSMAMNELAKQMIRVVDGNNVDWSGVNPDADIQKFWNEIGGRCRQLVKNAYAKMHTLEAGDLVEFFTTCQAVRSVG